LVWVLDVFDDFKEAEFEGFIEVAAVSFEAEAFAGA